MDTIDKVSHSAHEAFDRIASATNQAAETVGEKGGQLLSAEQHLVKNCRSYVRDNPMTSIGVAVAAGFVLSRLLSGR